MPSNSIGFCVAKTVKASGSAWDVPSTVTRRSCIASSSAAWVLAGRAVDLVAQHEVAEDRPGPEGECPGRRQEAHAGDVRRHQVGRELDAAELEAERQAEGPDQQRLGGAGHAFEQHVPAGEERGDRLADGGLLPQHDAFERLDEPARGRGVGRGLLGAERDRVGGHFGVSSSQSVSTASVADSTSSALAGRRVMVVSVSRAVRPRGVRTDGARSSSQALSLPARGDPSGRAAAGAPGR